MYLVRTEMTVRPGGAGELEAGIARLGQMRKGLPGYIGQTLGHSYSHPAKYLIVGRYENVEAAWAFNRGEVLAQWAKDITPGLVTITLQEGYESVFGVPETLPAAPGDTCDILVDWTLKGPGVVADFENSRRELFALRQKHVKGFVTNRLMRSGGVGNRYVIVQMYTDREAARAVSSAPELRVFAEAHPPSLYANEPPVGEAYFPIHRM